jgi:hypothetical protein
MQPIPRCVGRCGPRIEKNYREIKRLIHAIRGEGLFLLLPGFIKESYNKF